jgi:anti-sigma factor RsiW
MSHLDEGTLHALLDGELDLHEVKEIQAHIGSCAACGTRLREVKEFHGESDRLVGVLEMPSAPSRRTATVAEDQPEAVDQPAAPGPPPAQRRPPRMSGPAAEPPPLLLPENPDYGRSRMLRRMRWAALVLVIVGAGYMGNQMRQSGSYDFDELPLPTARTSDSAPGAVLSSEEAASAPEPASEPAKDTSPAEAKSSLDSVPKRVAPRAQPSPAGETGPAAAGVVKTAFRVDDSAVDDSAAEPAGNETAQEQSAQAEPERDEAPPPARPDADVRAEAARALQQLDRERQVDRAAAATAAIDSARRREVSARTAAAPPAPAPRTPEQRAQIYLRIGLDEAAKQLGRPVHVIEGRSPLFMGLALGRTSPGADTTRPVVRVVYQDAQGRLILLDQQRLRPGQATSAPGNEPHWIAGEISLHLSGEVGVDLLRSLRPRVR